MRDFLHDPDRADEIEDENLESYAERRKIQLINLGRRNKVMANGNRRTKKDLLTKSMIFDRRTRISKTS